MGIKHFKPTSPGRRHGPAVVEAAARISASLA